MAVMDIGVAIIVPKTAASPVTVPGPATPLPAAKIRCYTGAGVCSAAALPARPRRDSALGLVRWSREQRPAAPSWALVVLDVALTSQPSLHADRKDRRRGWL